MPLGHTIQQINTVWWTHLKFQSWAIYSDDSLSDFHSLDLILPIDPMNTYLWNWIIWNDRGRNNRYNSMTRKKHTTIDFCYPWKLCHQIKYIFVEYFDLFSYFHRFFIYAVVYGYLGHLWQFSSLHKSHTQYARVDKIQPPQRYSPNGSINWFLSL